jgi:hypothetical protein
MNTDKYNYQNNPVGVPTGQPGNIQRNLILKKREKIVKLKQFLELKVKIKQAIDMNKIDVAKNNYNSLYAIYQDLIKLVSEAEATKFQKDLSNIYKTLLDRIQNKHIKKFQGFNSNKIETNKDNKSDKKKVITTDFDVIIKTLEEKGKMNLNDIESQFNISKRLAEEWIQILSDYGLIDIRYLAIGGVEITKKKIGIEDV